MNRASVHPPAAVFVPGHFLLFWSLAGIGTLVALPCFVVWPIETLQQLRTTEEKQRQQVEQLRQQLDAQSRFAEAMRLDPMVTKRLALRDLGYGVPGHRTVLCQRPPYHTQRPSPAEPETGTPLLPRWIEAIYPRSVAALYRFGPNRTLLMTMSLSLILFALVVYDPRKAAVIQQQSQIIPNQSHGNCSAESYSA